MQEVWAAIPGVDGYEISSLGNARTFDRQVPYKDGRIALFKGRALSSFRGSHGYGAIYLPGGRRMHIHRLVAEAFVSRRDGCDVVNHMNGDKTDNSAANLEWTTMADNNRHARASGLHPQHGENCNLTRYSDQIVLAIRRVHEKYGCSYRELATLFDISEMQAADIIKERTRRAKAPA